MGEVTGKILFQGEKPKLGIIRMDEDPVCAAKHSGPAYAEDGAVNSNGTLPNAFVYVKRGAEKYAFQVPADAVTLDQEGCIYKPHVLGIMVGQDLRIVSSDATMHNIHAMGRENRAWNESQQSGAPPIDKKFSRPEVMIPVKCNQHPWMRAYIGVMRNPFFSVTGGDGTYTLKGLPSGSYTIGAWTATFGTQERQVTVPRQGTVTLNFTFQGNGS